MISLEGCHVIHLQMYSLCLTYVQLALLGVEQMVGGIQQ